MEARLRIYALPGTAKCCALTLAAALLACPLAARADANELREIKLPVRHGEIADKWLPGYDNPPRAKVLLPDGYDPHKRYPLLVLLAGASSDYTTWADYDKGRIKTTAAGFPGIIVMPEGGTSMYVDWWNGGERGDPSWETYYMDDVIPDIRRRYPIRRGRRWHALGGVSMGGLGTAYLGSRLPGYFGSLAIISGVPDIHFFPSGSSLIALLPQFYAGVLPPDPEAVWGPAEGFYAWGHDPIRLAANLADTRVYMARGNGVPTDDGEPMHENLATDIPAEVGLVTPASDAYSKALEAAGVDYRYDVHAGIHDFANFRPEFRAAVRWGLFRPVVKRPSSWVYDTVATEGKSWDVRYHFDRPPDRIVRFRRAGHRLAISAAGSAVRLRTASGCNLRLQTPTSTKIGRRACESEG